MTTQNSDTVRALGVFDDDRYRRLAVDLAPSFSRASPFPHVVIDHFLPDDLASAAAGAFPDADDESWVRIDRSTNQRVFQYAETRFPALLRDLVRELSSSRFLLFLEVLSGIEGVVADPYVLAGGLHASGRGEHLDVHEDWNWHHKLQLHRRLNALLYLTDPWLPRWGGQLEFWEPGGAVPAQSIDPLFNRLVVFETEGSLHGHPTPNSCPDGVFRRTLNLYYYVSPRVSFPDDPHFTRYEITQSPLAVSLREDFLSRAADGGPIHGTQQQTP